MRALAPILITVGVLVASGCGGGTSSSSSQGGQTVSTATTAQQPCPQVSKPDPRDPGALNAPTTALDSSKRWTLTFRTSCGSFVVLLQPKTSPHAAASLVALARKGYFDNTIFHRIVPGFVIQGGDPSQSGSGGPGYTTVDTPKAGTRYRTGVVAMAKTATESPGAGGSQFFVMTADAPGLPPDYAVVGRVASGMPVVARIGELGDPADPTGAPTQIVTVDRVVVGER
jgi:peptidyl-prolyl cis-trans isomerase B (cyclophilin B)